MSQAPASPSTDRAFGDGLLARLGGATTDSPRTFWMLGHGQADFEAAMDLIEALMARHPRVDIVFTAPQPETRAWLRQRFPRGLVLPPPLPFAVIANRYMVNLNVRGLALLGALGAGDRAILKAANGRALPAVLVEGPPDGTAPPASALGAVPERLEHHFVLTSASQSRLVEAGVDQEDISLLPDASAARSTLFVDVVSHLLVQDLKLVRSELRPIRRRMERLALRSMDHPRLRRLLAFKVRRYDGIEDLRLALGDPQTILCLGNGPSSEGPAVAEVHFDALFRVNHSWKKRGFLTRPDVVFTGSKASLAALKGPIFGLQSIKSEARLLVTRFLLPQGGPVRYATVERFGLYLSDPRWQGIRPTNGATMLATAVALQPARLIVAGMDLFSHPAGSYPGDATTPNAYTPGHDPESELALLLEALRRYQGELVIVSEALRTRWEEYRGGAGAAVGDTDSPKPEDTRDPAATGRGHLRLA